MSIGMADDWMADLKARLYEAMKEAVEEAEARKNATACLLSLANAQRPL